MSNAFGAQGLELLATMMRAGGRTANATAFAAEAASLKAQIVKQMWNGTNFCDGPCSAVGGNSRVMTNMFMLAFGLVPAAHVADAWRVVADWGIEQIGDYGAFWWQLAIGSGYYTNAAPYPAQDDGSAMYNALTKCDADSWCSELRYANETTTRESWHAGTYSHEWGTSAIVGVTIGIMGVHQTAPAWATFAVKPTLGGLRHATITVPTIRGPVNVTAAPALLEVHVPCGSAATVCIPRSAAGVYAPHTHALVLDGATVAAVADGGHLCAEAPVGCGAGGSARRLEARRRL